jgi:methyl-accepting chemotaxis protein
MTTPRNPLKRVFRITKLRTELMLLIILAIVLPSLALVVISTETSESALRTKMEETTNSSIHILDKTLSQLIQLESAGDKGERFAFPRVSPSAPLLKRENQPQS